MSLHLPHRRLVQSALTLHHPPHRPPHHLLSTTRHRTIFNFFRTSKRAPPLDPLAADFLKKKPTASNPILPPPRGDLASSSIFESPDAPSTSRSVTPTSRPRLDVPKRDPATMAAALDPQPLVRRRWQRKMLIRDIRQRYRLNKTKLLLRTERESVSKSHMFPTSVKKLGPLARQIAGKGLEDAIVQMRFSKKKVAREVLKHLEYARDEAIVRRGMGLGSVGDSVPEQDGQPGEESAIAKPLTIEEKSGKKRTIHSPSQIYISQAWVGRGAYARKPDHRARGQVNWMRPPTTSITVLLKEEATRIRLAQEREQKRQRKSVWVPLPDRPVTAQRQYCLW